jgi:protein-tyrosine phosphatase
MKTALKHPHKNRYSDILPFDENRVKLNDDDDVMAGYINASHINFKGNHYVATQGPLRETIHEFWWMVWTQGVRMVMMLTDIEEKGRRKCERYWPAVDERMCFSLPTSTPVTPSSMTIRGVQESDEGTGFKIRLFELEMQGQRRSVWHVQFLGWPDHGVPDSPASFLQLIRLTRSLEEEGQGSDGKPVVVHCSAGCGRTGTFCLLHGLLSCNSQEWLNTLESIQTGRHDYAKDSVSDAVRELRNQRISMVQSEAQFEFCYKVLAYAAKVMQNE